jgi:membrane-bound lytic murein transglycosylase A
MPSPPVTYAPATFADLPGWENDDHLAAWKAFVASCKPVLAAARGGSKAGPRPTPQALLEVCERALLSEQTGHKQTKAGAKYFFETNFTPHSVQNDASAGLLTGYYEPLVHGARQPGDGYETPVYRRPADLVNIVAESERGAKSAQFTHMRKTAAGLVPYLTRAEIEQGALKGQNLELLYFRDPVDVFFMQIQGSARIELPDGQKIRITYDGKNGYPYTSVGRALIDDGSVTP